MNYSHASDPPFIIRNAEIRDDAQLRSLLRDAPMEGKIHLTFEREPNYFAANGIEGNARQCIVATDSGDNIIWGLGCRSLNAYVYSGKVVCLGYLGQLRLQPGVRGIKRLFAAYKAMAVTRDGGALSFDISAIAADNQPAIRLLERALPAMPVYHRLADYCTLVLAVPRKKHKNILNNEVDRAGDLSNLSKHLCNNYRRYSLAPYWDYERLQQLSAHNLNTGNFLVIKDGDDISSSLALWDQRQFKQITIKGYSPLVAMLRPLINILPRCQGKPALPKAPVKLNCAYLSHVAINWQKPDEIIDLIGAAMDKAFDQGLRYLITGFTSNNPLLYKVKNSFPAYSYHSRLYAVQWDRESPVPDIQGLIHTDAAIL